MIRHDTDTTRTIEAGTPLPTTVQLPNARFERKFVVGERSMADTPGLTDYRDHLHGAFRRSKTRVRWYGPIEATIARPTLERKLKH
jgi:hypothetical protein